MIVINRYVIDDVHLRYRLVYVNIYIYWSMWQNTSYANLWRTGGVLELYR